MRRVLAFPTEQMLVEDFLTVQVSAMSNDGRLAQALTGGATAVDGIPCTPTSPASMSVILGTGTLFYPTVVDASAFSTLPPDSGYLMKIADFAGVVMPIAAPTGPGQEIVYLIEASASEPDDTPATLNYFDSANTAITLSGVGGNGLPQNTRRTSYCNLELKAGAPAPAGQATAPATDPGCVPVWLVTVEYGQTTITAGNISAAPGVPRFNTRLFGGASAGDLVAETAARIQGDTVINQAVTQHVSDLIGSIAAEAQAREQGDTNEAAARAAIRPGTSVIEVHGASGNWTVPNGISRIKVTVVGGGAGGMGSTDSQAGAGGGGGGCAVLWIGVTPGQQIAITVGAGGSSGFNSGGNSASGAGGTSSFGVYVSATGGSAAGILAGSSGGYGYGGSLNIPGECGTDASPGAVTYGGKGGNSGLGYGSGGRAATTDNADAQGILINGVGYGGGGGGGYLSSAAGYGGAGSQGVVIIEY